MSPVAEVYTEGKSLREELRTWMNDCIEIYLEKREQYGNSFSESAETFKAKSDTDQTANVRLFLQREYDKLKRIHSQINGPADTNGNAIIEDALRDIVGYVIVLRTYMQTHGS